MLWMHKVAVASPIARALIVLPTFSFPKISHWRILSDYNLSSVVPSEQPVHGTLTLFLALVLYINVTNHVLTNIISDCDLVEFSVLGQLPEHLLIEILEMIDRLNQILLRHVESICECHCGWRIVIQMREDHGL